MQYPLRKGELLNTVAVFKSASFERGESSTGGVDELEAAYKDCVPAVRDALKNLGTSMRWPMYDRDPIENWVAGPMVLMGDAAHPMLGYVNLFWPHLAGFGPALPAALAAVSGIHGPGPPSSLLPVLRRCGERRPGN